MRASPARPTLDLPPPAASEGAKVGAQLLAMGELGSYGGSAAGPVLLPGSISSPGSGTRYDARVKPGVTKERGSLLPMWRDAVRSLFVDATAYVSLLDASSINSVVCEYMELIAILGSALLRKSGRDAACLVSAVRSPFFTPHRRG